VLEGAALLCDNFRSRRRREGEQGGSQREILLHMVEGEFHRALIGIKDHQTLDVVLWSYFEQHLGIQVFQTTAGEAAQHAVARRRLQSVLGMLDSGKDLAKAEMREQQRERDARVVLRLEGRLR